MTMLIKVLRKVKYLIRYMQKKAQFNKILLEKAVFLIGTPNHTNIGDSAIAYSEKCFLENNGFSLNEITTAELRAFEKIIKKKNPYLLCWHGGGNMGDQWIEEELLRRHGVILFSNIPTVLFPQTIYYSDTEDGRRKLEESIPVYNNSKLTIIAREKRSFDIMKMIYSQAKVLLTPDIVLSSTMEDYGVVPAERSGVLFVTRSDPEKAVLNTTWERLEKKVAQNGKDIRKTDMYSDTPVTKENRAECVRKKMQEFCGAELVITDRLHGMVFAALTGTPCIVFSNYNHKVKGTYDWISYLPYIRYCETVEDAEAAVPELLAMKECHFDNTPLLPHFEKLAEVVREKCPK